MSSQSSEGDSTEEVVLGISKTHVVFLFLFHLVISCILQFSETQGEVITPLGFPNEWDTRDILLPKPLPPCCSLDKDACPCLCVSQRSPVELTLASIL